VGLFYLPAALGAGGTGALYFCAVAGAVTMTFAFGAVTATGAGVVLVGTFVVGCVILFS
jgi:hypothetical protein